MREKVEKLQLSIRKVSQKARDQDDCVRFDIGQPSFDTPEHIKDAAREGLSQRQGYTSTYGMDELRRTLAKKEKEKRESGPKGLNISEENILVTTGGMEAIHSIFSSMLGSNDLVTLNDPCWAPYKLISEINGNKYEQVQYFSGENLTDGAKDLIERAEVAVVNTPSNPTGRVLSKEQSRNLGEFAEENDTFLISDEVYHRLIYERKHHSPAAYSSNSAVIGSVSKTHAMTGWRVGWAVAEEDLIRNYAKASRAMTACPPKIGQIAAIEALKNDFHVEEMKSTYRERRDLIVERMKDLGWEFQRPEGAIYTFPNVGEDSWEFCLEMIENGVSMVPGEPFGPKSDQNVRICFGSTNCDEINKGFDILEDLKTGGFQT